MKIYNLAAQSHVLVSFETPEYTAIEKMCGTAWSGERPQLRLRARVRNRLSASLWLGGKNQKCFARCMQPCATCQSKAEFPGRLRTIRGILAHCYLRQTESSVGLT